MGTGSVLLYDTLDATSFSCSDVRDKAIYHSLDGTPRRINVVRVCRAEWRATFARHSEQTFPCSQHGGIANRRVQEDRCMTIRCVYTTCVHTRVYTPHVRTKSPFLDDGYLEKAESILYT